ncbi:hypothetical protein BOTBODRAFT_120426, partial [Botryobasidium botryosum FD-172 SS1]
GPVLKEEVHKVEESVQHHVKGKLATGQSDGWKDVSKTSLVGFMITVTKKVYPIRVHNVSSGKKDANRLLQLVLDEIRRCEEELEVRIIAWCTDSGGDCKSMRKKLAKERPDLLTPDYWAHQINLIAGDYLKQHSSLIDSASDALAVIKWFNNHSVALGALHQCQQSLSGHELALCLPTVIRWTSHFLAFTRLLKVAKPMRLCAVLNDKVLLSCAGPGAAKKDEATQVLRIVNNADFWTDIATMCVHLKPLALAVNIAQGPATRLDHVLLALGNLYRLYLDASIDSATREFFLKPYIKHRLFDNRHRQLLHLGLHGCLKRLFMRVFPAVKINEADFYEAVQDYYHGRKEFDREQMALDALETIYKKEGKSVDILRIWQELDVTGLGNAGRNQLVHLAILLLSVAPNSASCDRFFSEMGIVHNKLRNRLAYDRVRETSVLKMSLRHSHEDAGLTRKRLKRKLGLQEESGAGRIDDFDAATEERDFDFRMVAEELIRDAADEETEEAEETVDDEQDPPNSNAGRPRIILYTREKIPLKDLFVYAEPPEQIQNGLDMYWPDAERTLGQEMEFYDAIARNSAPSETEELAMLIERTCIT